MDANDGSHDAELYPIARERLERGVEQQDLAPAPGQHHGRLTGSLPVGHGVHGAHRELFLAGRDRRRDPGVVDADEEAAADADQGFAADQFPPLGQQRIAK